ncbi:MAG TPA: hypothetical protein PLO56_02605 [Rhodothermales bacterium]|nr:hypothetical protein [Rhodothermales bacterium]
MKKYFHVPIFIALAFLMPTCDLLEQPNLNGIWEVYDGGNTTYWQFEDGSITVRAKISTCYLTIDVGSYTLKNGDTYTVNVLGITGNVQIIVDGNSLTWIENGTSIKMIRSKYTIKDFIPKC